MNSKELQNITMSTGGKYSLATRGAQDVINTAIPIVEETLLGMDLEKKRNFSFADIGCADGGTSLQMIGQLLTTLRSNNPDIEVKVHYTDQPNNDYNGLIKTVLGLGHFPSYLKTHKKVYPLFSANTFYNQILPDSSLDLGFSATAMHWLSKKPCNISNHVHMVGAEGDEYQYFSAQGKKDWETILLNRARELRSGGQLVLLNFCRDDNGCYLGNTTGVNMFNNFAKIWNDFLDKGLIRKDEYQKMTLPQYYNTVDEFSAPLKDFSNPVYQAGLRLKHIETHITACPFAEAFKEHKDPELFAKEYIPTIKSWNESIFFSALDPHRPLEERQNIIHKYYQTYQDQVQEAPKLHRMDYVHAFKVIEKI